jgi:hypothetical protein
MFQRATLTLGRLIQPEHVSKIQMILTPVWLGGIGWLTTIGFYCSLVYLGFEFGWFWAIGGWIFSHIRYAIVPIPSNHFYRLIKEHLIKTIKKFDNDPELRAQLFIFTAQIDELMKKHNVG